MIPLQLMSNQGRYLTAVVSVPFRYLLHVFMEAGCLEWCVVIGLILRDANVIKQVISFLDSPEVPQETVQSVRSGLLAVDAWASTDRWVTCTDILLLLLVNWLSII